MTDLLRVGLSGLLAYQRALTTTSHNVANAGVEGYSRQRVELSAQVAGSPFGAGVTINGVQRLADVYANSRLVDDSSGLAANSRLADIAARVDGLLSDADTGLSGAINDFFAAAQDVAADPNNPSAREVLLGRAASLGERTNALAGALNRLDGEIDQRAAASVSEANGLLERLGRVNRDIAAGAGNANDLLDQRDRLTRQLAEHIGIRTAVQDGDQLNIYTLDGHALLLGPEARSLGLQPDPADPDRQRLVVQGAGSSVPIGAPGGGELGGLHAARTQVVTPALDGLGALVGDIARAVNAVQAAGTDLDGQPGAALFGLGTLGAGAHAANTGGAALSVSLADDGAIPEGRFTLRYSGGAWQITGAAGDAPTLSGSGTAADPLRIGALSVVVNGAPAEGDRFALTPGADLASGLRVNALGARQIAAAGALSPTLGGGNAGTLTVSGLESTDPAASGARTPASIVFEDANSYRIDGGALQTLGADGIIDGAGWRLTVQGQPVAGDSVALAPTAAGSGDNSAARMLAGLAGSAITGSGGTPAGAYADLVAAGGVVSSRAEAARDGFARLQAADEAAREATSGVNLDEEAANLIRLQQAYQAAAQVVSTADQLFQTLLGAVRG